MPITSELVIKAQLLNSALFEVDKIVRQATQLLSDLTKLTCIVQAPSFEKSHIKSIQLMAIEPGRVLSVIITDSGLIKNDIINVKKNITANDLAKMTILLNRRLNNLTIEEINLVVINNIKKDLEGHDDIFNAIIPALYESLSTQDSNEVYMEGASNIFDYPEFKDIDKAREFISLLYNKASIQSILKDESDMSVSIGDENLLTGTKDCSIITSVYKFGDRPLGSIAIIGPTRMPYSKVITLLTKVANEINEAISINIIDDR